MNLLMLKVINERIQISTVVCKFQETFPGELAIKMSIQAKTPRLDLYKKGTKKR